MDDITAINVLNMIQAHGPITIDAKNTAIEALMSKIEMENFIIQLSKIINSTEYPEYKEDDIFSLCSNEKLYPRVYKLIHDGRMKYKVKCRIDFADGDYSIENYDGVVYKTKEEAEAVAKTARVLHDLDAWVEEDKW